MKLTDTLNQQFRMSQSVTEKNVDGITNDESLVHPEPGGNNLNWILGHVVATRCLILPMLGQKSVWSEDLVNSYKRSGSNDVTAPFDEIVRGFGESYERLTQGIEGLTDDVLASPVPNSPSNNPNETVASLLVTIAFHESYHIGQAGVLRRIVGKEGVIK